MSVLHLNQPVRKLLVIKPSALGDIVHGLPFLDAVKSSSPAVAVHWVVAKGLHDLLVGHPLIDKLWIIDKNKWKRVGSAVETFRELKQLSRALRQERYDVVVDLQGLFRSGLIAGLSGAPVRVGFAEAREGSPLFYTHRVRGGRDNHAVDRIMKVAAFFGCNAHGVRFPLASAPVPPSLVDTLSKEYAVIAPAAGGEAKKWPPERFGQLASLLPLPSVVIGGGGDEQLAATVVAASGGRAVSIAGQTGIREMISVLRGARLFISGDTGPMHIAAALGIPVFAVFGPTNPLRTGPYGDGNTIVKSDLPCVPCYARKVCKDWRCMTDISVEKVLDAISPSFERDRSAPVVDARICSA